jgi:uncharacterized protein (TIGR02996 family)
MHDYDEAFIRDIVEHPEDTGLRLIYADWLEERSDGRAEFLRLEAELAGLPRGEKRRRQGLERRLRKLRKGIDAWWLARLDRTGIDNCELEFAFRCPKRWEKLQPTGDQAVRFCDACEQNVYHCDSVKQAREHAWKGHCVAIDSREARKPGDLARPYAMLLGMAAPPRHDPARVREGARVRVAAGEFDGAAGVIERVDHRRERALVRVTDRDANQGSAVILSWDEFDLA